MSGFVLELVDAAATRAAGVALGAALTGGDVIALVGDLGAGKTTLVTGVVDGAGGDGAAVSSPTFALIHEYPARLALVHVDLYRLDDERELDQLGLDEVWGAPGCAALVEWADKFGGRLPIDRVEVVLHHRAHARQMVVQSSGVRSDRLVAAWRAALHA